MAFEKEVRQRIAEKGRPLTGAEFADAVTQATTHAGQLLQRLLLGLDASLKRAQAEASKELREASKQLQSHNTAAIRVYLRDKASEVAEGDRVAVNTFRDQGLPMPSKEIEVRQLLRSSVLPALHQTILHCADCVYAAPPLNPFVRLAPLIVHTVFSSSATESRSGSSSGRRR